MNIGLNEYEQIVAERPRKLTAEEVKYEPASGGSALRCAGCLHYFRRNIDNLTTCEIFRSDETDEYGVDPAYRCKFFTVDGDVFPLLEETK